MREFMGFRFHINKSRRIKNSRLSCNEEGIFTFYFPYSIKKNKEQEEAEYCIKKHYKIMKKMQILQQNKYTKAMQYLEQNPNMLLLFEDYLHVDMLSIESLRKKFYCKVKVLLDEYAALMGVKYTSLTISEAKSYLGQCDSRARIKIDYRNMLSNEALLRYLVVHELAHIRHPNHSKRFWQEVEMFYKNYKSARKELREMANINSIILRHYGLLPKRLC